MGKLSFFFLSSCCCVMKFITPLNVHTGKCNAMQVFFLLLFISLAHSLHLISKSKSQSKGEEINKHWSECFFFLSKVFFLFFLLVGSGVEGIDPISFFAAANSQFSSSPLSRLLCFAFFMFGELRNTFTGLR